MWLTLSPKPTIRERQLFELLKDELDKNAFTVTRSVEEARWVLGLSADRRTLDFGSTSSTLAVPVTSNLMVARTDTKRVLVDQATVFLYLFDAADFRAGKALSIWEGQVSAPEGVYKTYVPAMLKELLGLYGINYEGTVKLDKSYIKKQHV